jgi:hypothetical protein
MPRESRRNRVGLTTGWLVSGCDHENGQDQERHNGRRCAGRLPLALRSRSSSKKMLAVHGRRRRLQPVERCDRGMCGIGIIKRPLSSDLNVAMAQSKMPRAAGLGENVASECIPLVV